MAEKKPVSRKKAVKPAKVEEKPAAPEKPKVTEARAIAYDVRLTPRKARMVIDLVRGKDLNVALGILTNINRSASPAIAKVVKSAAANAINNFAMDESKLYIHTIYANDGLRMKRYMPRAKGSSSSIIKRTCHIYVTVKSR
jgi:large subunit ribosomal protein L22